MPRPEKGALRVVVVHPGSRHSGSGEGSRTRLEQRGCWEAGAAAGGPAGAGAAPGPSASEW